MFRDQVKQLVLESLYEIYLPGKIPSNVFDKSVFTAVFDKNRDIIDARLKEFDIIANETEPNIYLFQTKIDNIGEEHFEPITGKEGNSGTEPLAKDGDMWVQKGTEPKLTNLLNILMDKKGKIKKIYAGRKRTGEDFFEKFKKVTL